MTGTATARRELSAAEAMAAIEAHRIGVFPALDGKLWKAWADVFGNGRHNQRRVVDTVDAIGGSALEAISKLARLLEHEQLPLDFDERGNECS